MSGGKENRWIDKALAREEAQASNEQLGDSFGTLRAVP